MSESRSKKIRTDEENPISAEDWIPRNYADTENESDTPTNMSGDVIAHESKFNFDNIPRDPAREIIKYLGPADKIRFCHASSKYRLFFDDPAAWRIRFIRHFPHLVDRYDMTAPLNFRQLFVETELSEYADLDIKYIRALRAIKEGTAKVNLLDMTFNDLTFNELSTQDNSGITIIKWASLKRIQPILDLYHQFMHEGLIASRLPSAQLSRAQTLLPSIILCGQGSEALTRCINAAPQAAITTYLHEEGHTLLHLAAQLGDAESVEILLARGCNPNTQDENGYSALLHAAKFGHAPVVKLLLEAGAKPNREHANDLHPLVTALLFSNFACAKLIRNAGGDPNGVTWSYGDESRDDLASIPMDTDDESAPSAIHIITTATMCGRADMVANLIALGADINCVNPTYNDPPLYYAVLSGHINCVDVLLKANAPTDIKTMTTKTNFIDYLSDAPAEVKERIPGFLAQFPEENFSVSIDQIAAGLGYDDITARLSKHRQESELSEQRSCLRHSL